MPERGKCQACGRYADLERVELRVRGVVRFDRSLCRRCADEVETTTRRIGPPVRPMSFSWPSRP